MVKGARTIAQYAIMKWLEDNGFVMSEFSLQMNGQKALLTDKAGEVILLTYDKDTKTVSVNYVP